MSLCATQRSLHNVNIFTKLMEPGKMSKVVLLSLAILAMALTACASEPTAQGELPRSIVGPVREAYQYAMSHPEELAKYPCHCGCDAMGHENALQCFVQQANPDGTFLFDMHGASCGVCVYTALDVRNMTDQGIGEEEILAHINRTYGS